MRSSVSYILTSATSEPNMSCPDYEQYSHDHAALLILVRQIGTQLKLKTFTRLYERIVRCNYHKITDSTGQVRNICIRFVKEYPVENNDWGDFQTHRKLLGLISIGKYDCQQELNEICRVHESLKIKYTNTLFDSRCILFGPDEQEQQINSDETGNEQLKFQVPSNFKTRALLYNDNNPCVDLETHLSEFINSLFWVLESKRLERSHEKIERVSLLLAPFEKKDFVGLDLESRNNKKRCMGRITKHLGDLSLQAGLINESLTFYYSARDTLKSVNDWLWLGAAYEGLCAASVLVLYPNIQRNTTLHRNSSLQDGSPNKSRSNSIISIQQQSERKEITNILSEEDICVKYREAITHYSKYQNAVIIEIEAVFKAARIAIELQQPLQVASFLQNVVFINVNVGEYEKIQRYEKLADLYAQIGFARKASFCLRLAATRYVSQNNPSPNWNQCYNLMLNSFSGHRLSLEPSDMLTKNTAGWPTLQIELLQEIVIAARRMGHGALATRHMTFLLQTMWNFLSPIEQRDLALQLKGLSAQCEGAPISLVLDSGIIIPPANLTFIPRCKMFKVQNLKPHLQPQMVEKEKVDTGPFLFTPIQFGSLDRRNKKPKSKMDFLWVENNICEVSLQLINPLPFELEVSNMRLLTAGPVFESVPETILLPPESPQLINLIGTPKECGELEILGYSTHTLGVKSFCRLKQMDNFLPQYSVNIIPVLPVMDVKTSHPQTATFSNFNNYENVVTSASLSLFNGESAECTITLTNISDSVSIDFIDISIQSALETFLQDQIFKWSQSNLEAQLPLASNATASLTLYLYSAANFLGISKYNLGGNGEHSSGIFCNSSHPSSLMSMSAGPSSLPSRINSPMHHGNGMASSFHSTRQHEFISSSLKSSNSGQSSLATTIGGGGRSPMPTGLTCLPTSNSLSTIVDAQLRLRYSGGAGYEAGYCRVSSVYISIEMLPSVQITNWDVIPGETSSHFYLVLDIMNLTSQEMELHYTPTKHILIEGNKCCSVAVPLNRCPLTKLSKIYMMEYSPTNNLELNKICSEHIANSVDLKWHLLTTETVGKVSLKGITLTPNMLDLVRMSPLNWNVTLNSTVNRSQEEMSFTIGESITLGITISNNLDKPLKQLILEIQFYQDHQNGVSNYRLDTRLATIGATKVILPTLEDQNQVYHECIVIFFTPGHYKADIQCTAPENLNDLTNAINLDTNSIAGHKWRYVPAVEIRINE